MLDIDAFLADSASWNPQTGGKLHALGIGWNSIYAHTFPATHPRVTIAMVLYVPYTGTNRPHQVTIRLDTQDGQPMPLGSAVGPDGSQVPVMQLGGQFNVGRPPTLVDGDEQLVPMSIDVNNIKFEHPDMYNWVISIDGEEAKRLKMRVSAVNQEFGPVPQI